MSEQQSDGGQGDAFAPSSQPESAVDRIRDERKRAMTIRPVRHRKFQSSDLNPTQDRRRPVHQQRGQIATEVHQQLSRPR